MLSCRGKRQKAKVKFLCDEIRTRTNFVRGGKARVTEFPEGGKPPQTPPRHHFKKFALQGQIF